MNEFLIIWFILVIIFCLYVLIELRNISKLRKSIDEDKKEKINNIIKRYKKRLNKNKIQELKITYNK